MSTLEGYIEDSSGTITPTVCNKLEDLGCESGKYLEYDSQLTYCSVDQITDCVKSVTAQDAFGQMTEGRFIQDYPGKTKFSYQGDTSVNLPPGASTFLIDFPSVPHKGGSQYLIIASLLGFRELNEVNFQVSQFTTAIYAVSKIEGNYILTQPETKLRKEKRYASRDKIGAGGPCVQTDGKSCLISWPMDLKVEFSITFKLNTKITGWLHGRLSDATSDIKTASDGDQVITISGKPTIVPGLFAWFKKTQLPDSLVKQYAKLASVDSDGSGWESNSGKSMGPDGFPYSIVKTAFTYDENGMAEVNSWLGAVGDKAAYAPTAWSAKSIQSGTQFEKCMKGQSALSGIVTTNATMFIGAPPTFDENEKTLDYKVTAPHYLPDGSEFKGMYNLLIRSDVARCIYGFTDAPVSATISIVSSDGTKQVATTIFSERNGWMYFAANNFKFSSPILKVKLKQEVSKPLATPTKSATTSPAAAAKKTTITCVKGKTTKKVSAKNPKCPMGFRKK
jgi:hypothetical protein